MIMPLAILKDNFLVLCQNWDLWDGQNLKFDKLMVGVSMGRAWAGLIQTQVQTHLFLQSPSLTPLTTQAAQAR